MFSPPTSSLPPHIGQHQASPTSQQPPQQPQPQQQQHVIAVHSYTSPQHNASLQPPPTSIALLHHQSQQAFPPPPPTGPHTMPWVDAPSPVMYQHHHHTHHTHHAYATSPLQSPPPFLHHQAGVHHHHHQHPHPHAPAAALFSPYAVLSAEPYHHHSPAMPPEGGHQHYTMPHLTSPPTFAQASPHPPPPPPTFAPPDHHLHPMAVPMHFTQPLLPPPQPAVAAAEPPHPTDQLKGAVTSPTSHVTNAMLFGTVPPPPPPPASTSSFSHHDANRAVAERRQVILKFVTDALTDVELHAVCSQFGVVDQARIVYDRATGRTRGYAFITFRTGEAAQNAVNGLTGMSLHGRHLAAAITETARKRAF